MFLIHRFLIFVFAIVCFIPGYTQQAINHLNLGNLDKYLGEKAKEWEIPGMAMAIVENGKTVFIKCYGVCDIGKPELIDTNTVFAIASITKTFTSSAIATLVHQNKTSWDYPVINYIPSFKMYDNNIAEQITIKDLLCHRSGLKTFSGDLIWYGSTYTPEEIISKIKFLKPQYGFREHFGYSNIMYLVVGEIIAQISTMPWEKYFRETFLQPLGMDRTMTSFNQLMETQNIATPHLKTQNGNIAIAYTNWDNIGAAGSMYSSISDIAKWINFQLCDTLSYGLSEIAEMQKIHAPIKTSSIEKEIWPLLQKKGYGLGWEVNIYKGNKIISHSGGYEGMVSQICILPNQNFGFAILTNHNSGFPYPLMFQIIDEYLGNKHIDYLNYFKTQNKNIKQEQAKFYEKLDCERDTTLKPNIQINSLLGHYNCDLYQSALIYKENNQLWLKFTKSPIFTGKLIPYKGNQFYIEMTGIKSLPKGMVGFKVEKEMINLQINIPNPDFDFSELQFRKPLNNK